LPVSKNNIFYFCLQAKKVDSLQINRINQSNVYPELPVAPLGGTGLLSFPKLIRVPFFNSKSANKVAEIEGFHLEGSRSTIVTPTMAEIGCSSIRHEYG